LGTDGIRRSGRAAIAGWMMDEVVAGPCGPRSSVRRSLRAMAAASPGPTNAVYWEVASDGGLFAFGPGSSFYGSMAGKALAAPAMGLATTGAAGG